jgi:amino acid adenylation domain-containing protein
MKLAQALHMAKASLSEGTMAHRQQVMGNRSGQNHAKQAWQSLWEVVANRGQQDLTAIAYRFVGAGGSEVNEFPFGDLLEEALRQAVWLREQGHSGDRVLLTHSAGPDFIGAFLACMAAGMIAVPAFPPRRSRHGDRVAGLLKDSGATLALSDSAGRAAMAHARESETAWRNVRWPEPGELGAKGMDAKEIWSPKPNEIAYLQYTSGSTSLPKGVMVTHGALMHNLDVCAGFSELAAGDRMLSWLPFFHDMGLVYTVLMPLVKGADTVYFTPNEFLQNPQLWPKLAGRFRATHLMAPNFAYDLCVRQYREEDFADLDLSALRSAGNGSEPVRAETCKNFERVFGKHGLRKGVVCPAYGLAEATLGVCARGLFQGALEIENGSEESGKRRLVTCGGQSQNKVTVVDPVTLRPCADGEIGELWIQGESVAAGYWNNPEATLETFGARLDGRPGTFLRTGDLGFIHEGEIVVSGRLKDLIIVRGRNLYPQDIEMAAAKIHADLEVGAAFALEGEGRESVVLVQEIQRHSKADFRKLAEAIAESVSREQDLVLDELVLVPAPTVPRTSSGKVQRRACRDAFLAGHLKVLGSLRGTGSAATVSTLPSGQVGEAWSFLEQNALALGGRKPEKGMDAPLEEWCLDSLSRAELAGKFRRRYGVDLEGAEYGGTLRSCLEMCFSKGDGLGPDLPEVSRRFSAIADESERENRWRCHPAMESMWAAQMAAPESNAYHIAWTLELEGKPDPAKFQRALEQVSLEQTAMRCGIRMEQDGTLDLVDSGVTARLEFPWSRPGTLKEALAWAGEWNRRPFDLARPPLWKAAWLDLEEGGCLLAFSFHHIIFDQHSLALFHSALEECYFKPERPHTEQAAPPSAIPLEKGSLEEEKEYWKARLGKLPATPWFRSAHMADPLPAVSLKGELSPEIVRGLKALAAAERCTPFCVAALAFGEALAGLTGDDSACFGTPFTLRDQPLSGKQIGYWVHPLPLHLEVPDGTDRSIRERLREASRQIRESMAHRHLSLAEAMRAAGKPVPGAFLVYYAGEANALERGIPEGTVLPKPWLGIRARARELDWGTVKLPLVLEVGGDERWTLNLERHPTAIEAETARLCLEKFITACRRFAEAGNPASLAVWKAASPVKGTGETVIEEFERRAAANPEAVALVEETGTVKYGMLALRARAVARALFDAGVRPGQKVGVFARPDSAWVAAVLGCFESGAVYVPLEPAFPRERLKAMIQDAGCVLVLSNLGTPEWASGDWLDLKEALNARPPLVRERGFPSPEAPAYVMFTSGSSGRPKGVQVGHSSLLNFALGIGERMRTGSQDRTLQFFSISFDPSMQDLFPALVSGGSIALPQRTAVPGVSELCGWVRNYGATVLQFPTAYWHALMREGLAEALVGEKRLRCVTIGGEAPSPEWVAHWVQVFGARVALFNVYGPTETCVAASIWEAESVKGMVPLGGPLPGVELAVVGCDGRALGPGDAGELWIGGAGLAQGYLNPEGLERSGFSPAAPDGERPRPFYRTGDRVQWSPRTGLVYLGRMDRQVKISGVRLDLGEVERLLEACPGVAGAVVEVEGGGEAKRLVAWVQAKPGARLGSEDLRVWLRERIPAQCLPGKVEVLAEFPLGATGKVDRKALLAASASSLQVSPKAHVRQPSPAEDGLAKVCEVFSSVLGVPVGPDDDFFALGGTSLKAVHAVAETGRRWGVEIPIAEIYERPTPRAIARRLARPGCATAFEGALASPLGELVRSVFSEVLGREIAMEEDFFASGGSSLKAVHAAAELGRKIQRHIPADKIYAFPTSRTLAAALDEPALADACVDAITSESEATPIAPGFERDARVFDAGRRDAVPTVRAERTSVRAQAEVLKPLCEGPGIPWILMPPVSGRLDSYRNLASHLKGKCNLFGFDLGSLPAPEGTGWDAWVKVCLGALRRELPQGELVLGGPWAGFSPRTWRGGCPRAAEASGDWY